MGDEKIALKREVLLGWVFGKGLLNLLLVGASRAWGWGYPKRAVEFEKDPLWRLCIFM
jgi:hypothetical protein